MKAKLSSNRNEACRPPCHYPGTLHKNVPALLPHQHGGTPPFVPRNKRPAGAKCFRHTWTTSKNQTITITCTGVTIAFLDGGRGIFTTKTAKPPILHPYPVRGCVRNMLPYAGTPNATSPSRATRFCPRVLHGTQGLLPTSTTLAVQSTVRDTMPQGDTTHRGQGTAPPPFPVYNYRNKGIGSSINRPEFVRDKRGATITITTTLANHSRQQ